MRHCCWCACQCMSSASHKCASCAHRKVRVTLLWNHEFKGPVYANELVIEQQSIASLVASKACLEMCVERLARSVRNTKNCLTLFAVAKHNHSMLKFTHARTAYQMVSRTDRWFRAPTPASLELHHIKFIITCHNYSHLGRPISDMKRSYSLCTFSSLGKGGAEVS